MTATSSAFAAQDGSLEDPLAYLPCSTVAAYRSGQIIYGATCPGDKLFLVIDGAVKVSRQRDDGQAVIVDIYRQDEFFGEAALLGAVTRPDFAEAVGPTKVMTWTAEEVYQLILKRPLLGLALSQLLAQRTLDLTRRIESFATDNIQQRMARTLLRFADRFGTRRDDGAVEMPPLTHQTIAQLVGTSREIVTGYMTGFRRQGYLSYSRRGIAIYGDALQAWLDPNATRRESGVRVMTAGG